jgi:hypothetical protein
MIDFSKYRSIVTKIEIPNSVRITTDDFSSMFYDMMEVKSINISHQHATNMYNMYCWDTNLISQPCCGQNVVDMQGAYKYCYNLTGSPVCGPNVTSMVATYYNCCNLTGSPVCGPNVTDMVATYCNCRNSILFKHFIIFPISTITVSYVEPWDL